MKATLLFPLVLLMAGCVSAPRQARSGFAVVRQAAGAAEVAPPGQAFKAARIGQKLAAGASARTGADGRIDFQLAPYGGVLALQPDSTLVFEQIGIAQDSQVAAILNLTRGRVTGDTLQLPANTKIVVKTPVGVHEIP